MNSSLIKKKNEIENIFREYSDDVFRFAYSKTLDNDIAKEIVSDTFMTFVDLYDNYTDQGKVKSFLFGIAINKLRQFWSTKKEPKNTDFDEEIHISTIQKPSLERKRLFKKLIKIIELLPNKYKLVVKLRLLEFKSIKEVANILKITNSNVTTIQNRALKMIKKKVNEK